MKQTLEEAAYDYATNKTKFRKEVLKEVYPDNYVSRKSDCMEDFQCGAEWHAKQSPWISVKEKAGCDSSNDCIVMNTDGEVFRAYFSHENKWLKYSCGRYDEVIEDVTHWMPIPSFDEILEANRDVLERIKEKGD